MLKITRENIGGSSTAILLVLATVQAKNAAASLADLTDNTGGSPDGSLTNVVLPATAPAVGANVPTKAAVETILGTIRDGLTEVGAKVVALTGRVPAFTATNSVGGAAADGTLAAIGVAPTADNVGPRCSKAGFKGIAQAYIDLIREMARDVNVLLVACGQAPLNGTGGGAHHNPKDHVYAALSTDTGAAAADSSLGMVAAECNGCLAALRDDVSELAHALNLLTTDTGPAAQIIVG
jgi:hypothetical protein